MSDRRTVLKVVVGAAGAATAGVTLAPVAGLVAAPVRTPSPLAARGGSTDGWSTVARLDDLAVGQYVQVPIIGSEVDAWSASPDRKLGAVWLLRRGEGADTLHALSAVCPHLGCLIDRQGEGFNCPCHGGVFAADGRAVEGPSPRGMDPLEVRVQEGNVQVKWTRYRLGVADRVKEG